MNKIFFAKGAAMLFAAAALLSACSSDDDAATSYYPEDNVVRVMTNVSSMATRASFDNTNLDNMGLSIRNNKAEAYSYSNIHLAKAPGSGVWTPDSIMLWHNATEAVDIFAYAPYDTIVPGSNEANPIAVETTQSVGSSKSDFLVYKKTGFVPLTDLNTAGAIPVNFSHALSRVDIVVSFGTALDAEAEGGKLTANPLTDFKVSGTNINALYDNTPSATEPVKVIEGTEKDVQPYESEPFAPSTGTPGIDQENAKATYSCILIPQTTAANKFTVSFSFNGVLYSWTSPEAVTIEPGKYHTLNLTVGKNLVVPTDFTVKKWDDTPSTPLYTD